jgi:MarR family transcriptional regulator, organic hydroperoxide resistance regulator
MDERIESQTERFIKAWHSTMRNLGPRVYAQVSLGLTPPQMFLLHSIRCTANCTVSQLAHAMEVKPSAITVMLNRLESHGFVSRARSAEDRRVVTVELTEAGREVLQKAELIHKSVWRQCLSQLNPDELESFVETFEELAKIASVVDIGAVLASIGMAVHRKGQELWMETD